MRTKLRQLFFVVMLSLVIIGFYSTSKIVLADKGGTTSASGFDEDENWQAGSGKPWKTFGNDKIDPNQNFIGTTAHVDLVIKTNNNEQMRVKSSGNVGIGTTTPAEKLEVVGTVKATKFVGDGTMLTVIVGGGGDPSYGSSVLSPNDAVFVNNSGNVGIGTTDPGNERLFVSGRLFASEDIRTNGDLILSQNGSSINFTTGTATNQITTLFGTHLALMPTGNVGIGTTGPTEKLEVAGNILASGAITPGSSRDIKRDISNVSTKDAMKAVMGLKPVKFKYKADNSGEEYLGFIAEDVPDLVAMDDRKHLNPTDLTAVFAKVIQEQQRMLQEAMETISALSEKVKVLEGKI